MSEQAQEPQNQAENQEVETQVYRAPEQPAAQPEPAPAAAAQNTLPDDDLNLAMLAHLGGILLGFIPALIIWLMNKDKADKAFVNDQAKEALNFQITLVIGYIASGFLYIIFIGFILTLVLLLANLVLCILAALAAKRGETYRYPFALRLLK
ncbi:putative Tic20 family protein [Neisseria sp. HSC-16F19]|nr:DUF4870 domain-containing protein [Neisseria sp. HSC-16F19]MCP2041196.1 putative Tic20 family protein [Neisseria sp. HSC-16F19]